MVVGFRRSEFFVWLKQDQKLLVTATDPQTGTALDSVELVFFGRAREGWIGATQLLPSRVGHQKISLAATDQVELAGA